MAETPGHNASPAGAASRMAAAPGLMWAGSFLCLMYGLDTPGLGAAGYALAIGSLFVIRSSVARYRSQCPGAGFARCWALALYICLFAGLIADTAQFAYFRFLDNGRVVAAVEATLASPEAAALWEKMSPGMGAEAMADTLRSLTVGQIVGQMMVNNALLALPLSLLEALLGRAGGARKGDKERD